MSCFLGQLNEFSELSLDQFEGKNLSSSVFFLSHCHSDHMVGLSAPDFSAILASNHVKLYCHSVTTGLLCGLQEYAHLISGIESLECNNEYSITTGINC